MRFGSQGIIPAGMERPCTTAAKRHCAPESLVGPAESLVGSYDRGSTTMNHQPAQRRNRVTAIFEHARIAFDMARGVTLAQLAEQSRTLGDPAFRLPI